MLYLLIGTLTLGPSVAVGKSPCLSSSPCFPTDAELAAFNQSIGGKLHAERPLGAPCYPTDPSYDPTACQAMLDVTDNFQIDQLREDVFGAYQNINWEPCHGSDACFFPPQSNSSTCDQGRIPTYSVHATSSDDVINYLNFVRAHDLLPVVKNTGHDYAGRSSGKGGFGLWTHNLQGISRDPQFVPTGCSHTTKDAVTAASGVQWLTLYEYADRNNVTIVGGDTANVGCCGGWIFGAGHSVISPTYGLGVDNLLQATIVTADGIERTVNECQDPDLFWAIRGGGPGSWGVLTSVTYKTHPAVPFAWVSVTTSSKTIDDNYKVVQSYIEQAQNWANLGGGGFFKVYPTRVIFLGIIPDGTTAAIQKSLAPVQENLPNGTTWQVTYTEAPNFLSFFDNTFKISNEVAGITTALASRLIPTKYFKNDPAGVAQALREGQAKLGAQAYEQPIRVLVDSPAPKFNKGLTSTTPVWYDSFWHSVYLVTWPVNATSVERHEAMGRIHEAAQVLRDYAPDGGAYINEADVFEPNSAATFWGEKNYERLKAIKAKYDPTGLFQTWQGIGWDGPAAPEFQCYASLIPIP